ncbi:MAG TPA: 7-cyano-7-deazaguanine synthase QueC [bacterium]|nr:7-cyano-7-deazaguanine synthase QueC [bacterium]
MAKKKAVVLVSGGLDSTTCLAIAKSKGFELYALTLSYGQRHKVEVQAAREVAKAYRVKRHLELEVPLTAFGGSALTDKKIKVPKQRSLQAMAQGIPSTYVPARNTVFLSLALAWAEVLGAEDIFIGVNALDYSGYPDCRPEFIRAYERLAQLATKKGVEGKWKLKVHTPLIRMSKARIIRTGLKLGVDYGMTHSCYDPEPVPKATSRGTRFGRTHSEREWVGAWKPCGRCDSCLLRAKGFLEVGQKDPVFS